MSYALLPRNPTELGVDSAVDEIWTEHLRLLFLMNTSLEGKDPTRMRFENDKQEELRTCAEYMIQAIDSSAPYDDRQSQLDYAMRFRQQGAMIHHVFNSLKLGQLSRDVQKVLELVTCPAKAPSQPDTNSLHPSRPPIHRSYSTTDVVAQEIYTSKPGSPLQINHDDFSFDATLTFVDKGESTPTKIPVRGKMDTGSTQNWLSRKVIAGTYLEHTLQELSNPKAYRAFGGSIFFPIGEVTVRWYLDDGLESRQTTFLVGDEVPFDMVVGSILIQEEELLARKEAALGVRTVDPTAEELEQMRAEAESGARSTRQLVAIENARRELDAKKRAEERDRLRAQHSQVNGTASAGTANGSSQASSSGGPSASTR